MNTLDMQNKPRFENGMNFHLISFALPKNIIKEKDEIRVNITTIPEEKKQNFSLEGKKMCDTNHVFSLNVTDKTQRIIMTFRKKTFFAEGPIIASTIIHLADFADIPHHQIMNGIITTKIKFINIYYPLRLQREEENKVNVERKVLGQMKIQLTFMTPYFNNNQPICENNNKFCKNHKINKAQQKKHSKKSEYDQLLE